MEEQTLSQPTPTSPVSSPAVPVKQTSKSLIVVTILVFLLMAGGLVYLGYQNYQLQQKLNQLLGQQANVPQPTPEAGTIQQLPSGWEYKLSQQQKNANECVKFALPPIKEPYVYILDENRVPSVTDDKGSGRFWYLGGGTYPNLLFKVIKPSEEYKQTMAIFATEIEASGYISQAVAVSCVPNNGRFSDNSELISSLTSELSKYNQSTGEKDMQASTYAIKSNNSIKRWGNQAVDLTVSEYFPNPGGQPYSNDVEYTIFVTPQYVYEVKVFGSSTDFFVNETARKIFDNLSF